MSRHALLRCSIAALIATLFQSHTDRATANPRDADPEVFSEPLWLDNGLVLPYPLDNVFRGFAECRRGRHRHQALDIGGVGPDWGIGTPVRAMTRSRIVAIHTPEDNPERFGRRLTRAKRVTRGRRELPTSAEIAGYGKVWFFTEDYGRSRTGVMLATVGLDGRLKRHKITYMHLAAVHPSLSVGDVVEAGQEVGLLGGTAVQESAPHVHLTVESPRGRNLDVGPLLGIGATRVQCRRGVRGERAQRAAYTKRARQLMAELRRAAVETRRPAVDPPVCGIWEYDGAVEGARVREDLIELPGVGVAEGATWRVRLTRTAGAWQPRLAVETALGRDLFDGRRADRADARAFGIERVKTGQRGDTAELTLEPRETVSLIRLRIGRWRKDRLLPEGAGYKLLIERPCRAPGELPSPSPTPILRQDEQKGAK